jgi:hypothetical protein
VGHGVIRFNGWVGIGKRVGVDIENGRTKKPVTDWLICNGHFYQYSSCGLFHPLDLR